MFDGLFAVAGWLAIPLLVVGFLPLVKGADWLVDGGSALAARFNIPTLVIGLTIVAFGTSMPEFVVNMFAAVGGNTDISMGNIVGSNIFNVLGILGVSAMVKPIHVKSSTTWIEIPLTLAAALAVAILANDLFLGGASIGQSILSRGDGLILLLFFAIFLGYTVSMAISGDFEEDFEIRDWSKLKAIFYVIAGLVLLVVGGKIIVECAVQLARSFGVTERVIGLTIVSIGTSLPELATSVVAARKGNSDIALGNIVGSNIFNIFLILGLTAVIAPIPLNPASNLDIGFNILITLLLMAFVFFPKNRTISRPKGGVFVGLYVVYVVWLVVAPLIGMVPV